MDNSYSDETIDAMMAAVREKVEQPISFNHEIGHNIDYQRF